jgi:hypothetical protein
MLKYSELYEGVLRHLDKYSTPSFELGDFNQFANEAISNDVRDLLDIAKEGNRPAVLELQRLEKIHTVLAANDGTADKPSDFWHPRSLLVIFKPAVGATCKPFGEAPEISADLLLPEHEDAFQKPVGTYYIKPAVTRPYYRAGGAKLEVLTGNSKLYAVDKVRCRYVARPAAVALQEDASAENGILASSDGISPFTREADERLIVRIANSLMLRGEDVRLEPSVKLK